MAIVRSSARLLFDECRCRPFKGSVMQLGRHTIYLKMIMLKSYAAMHGLNLREVAPVLSNYEPCAELGYIDDITFFSALGFDTVHSCDVSDCDASTFNFDLNLEVPDHFHNKYDVIIDSGTVEHIFNLPQVLRNIHLMLKPNGRVIFMATPTNNYVDHGYYMFSPVLLYEYYLANRYEIHSSFIINHTQTWFDDSCEIIYYQPGVFDPYSYGGCGTTGKMMATWLCVEKNEHSVCSVIPQQGCSRKSVLPGEPVQPQLKLYATY